MTRGLFFYVVFTLSFNSALLAKNVSIAGLQEFNRIVYDNPAVVVKFCANWCRTCEKIQNDFKNVIKEEEFSDVLFININTDFADNKEIVERFGVIGIPTFAYLVRGQKAGYEIGVKNLNNFADDFRNSIRSRLLASVKVSAREKDFLQEKRRIMLQIRAGLVRYWSVLKNRATNIWRSLWKN